MLFRNAARAPHAHLNRINGRGICDDFPALCGQTATSTTPVSASTTTSNPHTTTSAVDPVGSKRMRFLLSFSPTN